MQQFKQHIIQACKDHLTGKINALNTIMSELSDSANSDSKSSAGDKHETARAMVQLEQEKTGNQLKDAEEQLADFIKYDFSKANTIIGQGSLIETDKGYFFIAGSIGKIAVDQKTVFVISGRSPLAIAFIGKKEKESVIFNNTLYAISDVS